VVTFDEVLPTLLRACETDPGFDLVEKAVVVRDLRGRVHLAIRGDPSSLDSKRLEDNLRRELGAWFEAPVLMPGGHPEVARLCNTVLGIEAPWRSPEWVDPDDGRKRQPADGRWHLIERHLSKTAWVGETKSSPPWPLVERKPAIVTFYSFKGGVGRTTLLASAAWQLAEQGKRVVVVDLDVEAPGAGALLGARTDRGVLDFLVDHAATGSADLDRMIDAARTFGAEASLVDVVTSGELDRAYFEKLARLDYTGSGLLAPDTESPVRQGLQSLLKAIAARSPAPDFILLDSRAGLHDVAGLSLHDLAHVDVLVGRDSDQGYRGLELTVEALGRRRKPDDLRAIVVQTMAPEDPSSPEYDRITEAYRRRSHAAFVEHVYSLLEPADPVVDADPAIDDPAAPHHPQVIRFNARLVNFTSLSGQRAELFGTDFVQFVRRLVELSQPEGAP